MPLIEVHACAQSSGIITKLCNCAYVARYLIVWLLGTILIFLSHQTVHFQELRNTSYFVDHIRGRLNRMG